MLAVPGWLEAHKLPNPVAVASALKNMPWARLDVRRCEPPERQDIISSAVAAAVKEFCHPQEPVPGPP